MNYDVTYCSQPCGNKRCGLRLPDEAYNTHPRPVKRADFGSMADVCIGFEPRQWDVDSSPKS